MEEIYRNLNKGKGKTPAPARIESSDEETSNEATEVDIKDLPPVEQWKMCKCRIPRRVIAKKCDKNNFNSDRRYFTCANWDPKVANSGCKTFEWIDPENVPFFMKDALNLMARITKVEADIKELKTKPEPPTTQTFKKKPKVAEHFD